MLRGLMRSVLWKAEFLARDTSGMLYVQKARTETAPRLAVKGGAA